ncbi:MAG: hypothetical protein HKN13_00560 [Rhodothermales bacterium]|nr:hypothetical protein [Rhodothermales bacterium]
MAVDSVAQTSEISVSVEYIAGQNIYITWSSDTGVQRRDTLDVLRNGIEQGQLRVISITSRRAVTTFVGNRFAVDFGDQLTVRYQLPIVEQAILDSTVSTRAAAAPASVRKSILESTSTIKQSAKKKAIRVSGRVSFENQSLRTLADARADSLPKIRTNFSSTNTSVRTTIDRLPIDLKVNVHFRAAYRRSSVATTLSPRSIRVYRASIEKRLKSQPISFELGRFYSIYEDFSGYWDGAIVRYGQRAMGAGVAFGFEPTLSNEGFDPNLPKYTAFADIRARMGSLRYDADVSFHEVRGRNQYSTHDYVGIQHSIRSQRIRLSQDLQVNRDPESSSWMVTRFQTSASVPLLGRLKVTGRYLMRRPYYVWRTQNFMSSRRDRYTAGANLRVRNGITGVNVTTNSYEGRDPYTTYSAFLNLTRTAIGGMGFTSSASMWNRNDNGAFSANVGLSKAVGRLFLRGRYRYYRTSLTETTLTTHSVHSSVDFRLPERINLAVQVQVQFGDTFQNTSIFTGLWKSF